MTSKHKTNEELQREARLDCYACGTDWLTTRGHLRRATPHNRLLCACCEAYEKGYRQGYREGFENGGACANKENRA